MTDYSDLFPNYLILVQGLILIASRSMILEKFPGSTIDDAKNLRTAT